MESNIESYNIFNIVKFNLINKMQYCGLLKKINTEYQYFRSDSIFDNPDFTISIYDYELMLKLVKSKNSKYFLVDNFIIRIETCGSNSIVNVQLAYNLKGSRRLIGFTALKNILVRSLLSLHLFNKGSTLVHGAGVSKGDNASIFVGRPGVFKTTITMKMVKEFNLQYLGEENILFHDDKVFPFPLNEKSFSYKIQKWESENPNSKIDKLLLGVHILFGKEKQSIKIFESTNLKNIFYLKKGERFSIDKLKPDDKYLEQLISNEQQELDICPTHFLSGINNNSFNKIHNHFFNSSESLEQTWSSLRKIFKHYIKSANVYNVTVPADYTQEIHLSLLKHMI